MDLLHAHLWVQRGLRLLLQLNLLLPEQQLALGLHDVVEEARLGRLDRGDLLLKLNRYMLKLLQLVHELHLHHRVRLRELALQLGVLPDELVQPLHVLMHVLDHMVQPLHLGLVRPNVLIQPQFLLGEDGDPRPELRVLLQLLLSLRGGGHQLRLVREPLALQLRGGLVDRHDLLPERRDRRLEGPHMFHVLLPVHQQLVLAVQPVHAVHLLLDLVVALADLKLVLLDQLVLILELGQLLFHHLPQLHVVGVRVERVDPDAAELVLEVRRLDLLIVRSVGHGGGRLHVILDRLVHREPLAVLGEDRRLDLLPLPHHDLDVLVGGLDLGRDRRGH
mmetsp:Transcript_23503/g.48662  ORF Transcript_23503/g.48662 Transcript_23503/m.48662 type:complete len:334 (-) Transcript_23503:1330-2331(-)